MDNKELIDFDKDKQAYNSKIINAKTKEDKELIKNMNECIEWIDTRINKMGR